MQIVKLNCTACGAPISIPEDIDVLFCTSCGSKLAVDRGEGYVTLKLVEKLTQAIQDSGEKSQSAIKENTFVTKVELKRVQISQSVNTEEMKLSTIRQEIRSLTRKPQMLPIEVQQLAALRLDECSTLMRIRKLNLDSAKLDEGWEESLEVFQADLAALNEIIRILAPFGADLSIGSRLNELNNERIQCEKALTDLETRLLSRQLKSLKSAPLAELSVEDMEKLSSDLQTDLNLLVANPQTAVKIQLRNQLNTLLAQLNAIYPRKKVESATGELKSLDLKPPFSEIPWQLIPLIELAESDLEKVRQSPDNPSKILIKNVIENKTRELKALQAMDLPSRRVLAEKQRKQKRKVTSIVLLSFLGLIILVVVLASLGHRKDAPSALTFLSNTPKNDSTNSTQTQEIMAYQAVDTEFFEIVAQRTYLRHEPDINSPETDPFVHSEMLYNLGQSASEMDWFQVQDLTGNRNGFLLNQWISPVHGHSIEGSPITSGGTAIFSDDFSNNTGTWFGDAFDDNFGQGNFAVENGVYQVDLTAANGGSIYSKIDLNELPANYVFSVNLERTSGTGSSAAGIITNFVDPDNYDYLLLSSDGNVIVGVRRNAVSNTIYNSGSTPNEAAIPLANKPNQLSVWVESADKNGPNQFTYALNGKAVYTLQFDKTQKYSPTIGVIVWSVDANMPVSYAFDNVTVNQVDH